jgi:hypothetical protein
MQTLRVTVALPLRVSGAHFMSAGHSEPFVLGVHWRTHDPPAARAGTLEQNVSAQPGWSAQNWVQAIEQMPVVSALAPRQVVPVPQSLFALQ